jgi:drug/metabolite transporter (DMT)-like permease
VSNHSTPSMLAPRVLIPFIIVTLIWGSTWLVIRGQLGVVNPSWSVTYRFLIGGLIMLGYAVIKGQSLNLGRSGQMFAAVLGTAQFAFNFNFVYRAEHFVTSGLVAVVFALLVVPNAVFGRVFLGNRMTSRFLLGSAVAMTGVAMLFVHELQIDPGASGATLTGIGLTMAGVMSASIANVMQATNRARLLPSASLLGWAMLWGATLDACFAYLTAGPPTIELTPVYLGGLFYLGVIASAIAFTLYFGAIRIIGPAKAAYSSVVIPIIAMGLSTFFEHYEWSILSACGGFVALIGMIIALGTPRRTAPAPDSQPAKN